jgi:hypothetical protein
MPSDSNSTVPLRQHLRAKVVPIRPDFCVRNEGSIFLFHPVTAAAKEWGAEHIPDDAQYFGHALVVEHRYAANILDGILAAGLEVR